MTHEPASLEELNRELARIQDELLALPSDAFAARHTLLTRQDELRERATDYAEDWDAKRPTAELMRELNALESALEQIVGTRINMVSQSGGGSAAGSAGGADGYGAVYLNVASDEAQGAGALRTRIGRIKGILIDRGEDLGEP